MIQKLNLFRKKKKFEDEGSVYSIMWRKFLKNRMNVFFLIILVLSSLLAILGYLITPDATPFANKQYLELTLQKPGSSITMLHITKNTPVSQRTIFGKMIYGQDDLYDKIPVYSYSIEGDYVVAELFTGMSPNDGLQVEYHLVDVISSVDTLSGIQTSMVNGSYQWIQSDGSQIEADRSKIIETIKSKHISEQGFLLGTDRFGRDVLSQLIIGARVSLSVGLISVLISLLIGVTLGAIAGYYGGSVDRFILWIINVVWAIPTLFLVIAITFALGKGFWQIFIAVGLTLWVEIARLVRGLVMSLRTREYVEAARSLGFSDRRIIMNHILPGTLGPVIVVSAANFASAILIESGLSFLGIGISPPMPSWGTMLRENYGFLVMDYAYLAIIPGLAIMLLVLTFMVIGNGIRDAMDVRQL